ncbi:MAG: serine hydrolase [Saprospiraceae bacterium]|nr:serine hydrolase [Saprospiraceae bacterium]
MKLRISFLCFLFLYNLQSQSVSDAENWVSQRISNLTLDEKIGQLFIIRAYGKDDSNHIRKVEELIKNYYVGGLCFFQGEAIVQARLTNYYQSISNTPLFISMDAEWSLGMRLKNDGFSYPRQLCLGAIRDNRLIYEMGKDVGTQLNRIGVNFNFAPVVDINSNPDNPVINDRSFGEDRQNVVAKSYAYMKGMQDEKILSCAKHFPGHGDTDKDSHIELPRLIHSKERLDSIELFPFKILCEQNIASVMVGHLSVPALAENVSKPSSVSHQIITGILRDQFKYKGLIVTDALEMKAVSKLYSPGELELDCYKAGNDILLLSENIEAAFRRIKMAIQNGEITIEELNQRVTRILQKKFENGIDKRIVIDETNLKNEINSNRSLALKEKLYRNSVTLIKDSGNDIPIRNLENQMACLSMGSEGINYFQKRVSKYADVPSLLYKKNTVNIGTNPDIRDAEHLIISLHKLNYKSSERFGLTEDEVLMINSLSKIKKVHLCIFGSPYAATLFPNVSSIVLCYENNRMIQEIAAEMIFGSDPIQGILPVNINKKFRNGNGIKRPSLLRIGYSIPESQGMSSDTLNRIAEITSEIINKKAAPGGQIIIARNNKIIYEKNFGTLRYDSSELVTENTLYDVASLTKILASAPCLMLLDDQNKLDLGQPLSTYLPVTENSNKAGISIRDALLHQASMISWIPYYKSTLISPDTLNIINTDFYRDTPSDSFSIPVADKLFLRTDYKDSILNKIVNSRLHETKKFLYSDLFFYFIPDLVRNITGKSIVEYLNSNFFRPLGLRNIGYCPLQNEISTSRIAPSEEDRYFRHQEIRGFVHDMGSAMCGGVSGHAGIFSNAQDVTTMMQFFLNYGNYGGKEFISNSTIKKFTKRDNELKRRGLIFDMPEELNTENPSISNLTPKSTFGHTGFTGTCAWADPENNIVFVFLSNRTYPDGSVNLLHKYRYRVKIQDLIYKSLIHS